MAEGSPLDFEFVEHLIKAQCKVSVYLTSGIQLKGYLRVCDQQCYLLISNTTQLIYKHSISTIMLAVEANR